MKLTKQQIEKAVNWWGEVLKNPKYDNGDNSGNGILTKVLTLKRQDNVSNKDIRKFQDNLRRILEQDECDYHSFILTCDYTPNKNLRNATKGTNINETDFPWKTTMVFRKGGKVLVRYGYSSPWKELGGNNEN